MAGTRQIVIWSLEQECCLRDRKLVPGCRDDALLKARDYSNGLRNQRGGFGVFGDVYVGSCTTSHGTGKLFPPYPERGFVISEAFQQFGGTAALFQICARCPANTSIQGLAGCFGSLYLDLYSKVIERRLDGIVERLGVASELSAAFPATKPVWYGLWAVSPVPEGSLALLKTIISEMLPENSKDKEAVGMLDQRQIRDFSCFLKAIDLAQRHKMPLQVSLSPPGHTDFGIYTVFPHCPFCKAFASTELWKRKYPTALQKCSVCGTEFSPAETAASTRMTEDWHDLREILSEKRFREFAYEYLLALGVPPDAADLIVEETEAWEKQRREKASRDRNLQRLKDNLSTTTSSRG